MSKQGTLHLVYWREYRDESEKYNPFFKTYYTIFRNAPLSQLDRLSSSKLHDKIKIFCDKNYKEDVSNFTGGSGVEMIHGSEYYHTYNDEFGNEDTPYSDSDFYYDYCQSYNGRQFFKHDFLPKFTEEMSPFYENGQFCGPI